jgi:hypothetical protein
MHHGTTQSMRKYDVNLNVEKLAEYKIITRHIDASRPIFRSINDNPDSYIHGIGVAE